MVETTAEYVGGYGRSVQRCAFQWKVKIIRRSTSLALQDNFVLRPTLSNKKFAVLKSVSYPSSSSLLTNSKFSIKSRQHKMPSSDKPLPPIEPISTVVIIDPISCSNRMKIVE